MTWKGWTEKDWDILIETCRELFAQWEVQGMDDAEIRKAGESYMERGADGGGNRWGILGKIVANEMERIDRRKLENTAA